MATFQSVAGDVGTARHRILSAIRAHGPLTRAQLARAASLAPSTVTEVVQALAAERTLVETEIVRSEQRRTGPKSRALAFEPSLSATVGVDFGFRTVRALVADASGTPLADGRADLPADYGADEGLRIARQLVDEVIDRAGVPRPPNAGVAVPGPIDTQHQEVVASSILPGWAGYDSAAFESAWKNFPDAQWRNGRHFVAGDRGVSQWTFTGTAADGTRSESDGVDLFTFKDGKILVKNVFRKNRPALPAA